MLNQNHPAYSLARPLADSHAVKLAQHCPCIARRGAPGLFQLSSPVRQQCKGGAKAAACIVSFGAWPVTNGGWLRAAFKAECCPGWGWNQLPTAANRCSLRRNRSALRARDEPSHACRAPGLERRGTPRRLAPCAGRGHCRASRAGVASGGLPRCEHALRAWDALRARDDLERAAVSARAVLRGTRAARPRRPRRTHRSASRPPSMSSWHTRTGLGLGRPEPHVALGIPASGASPELRRAAVRVGRP